MRSLICPERFKSLLSASKHKSPISQIHAFIISTGIFQQGSDIGGNLIASYGRIGDISHARKVFDRLPHTSISAYNCMVVAYSRRNNPDEVVGLYDQMIAKGVKPDSSIFTVTIKACVRLMITEKGEAVWCKAAESGYADDVFVCSSALSLYTKCGKMDEATSVFSKMAKKDLVCWTTMVTGFAQARQPMKAVEFYRKMQEEGFYGDGIVMVGLMQACADLGNWKIGLSIHGYIIRRDFHMDVVVATSLVDMYAKVGFSELSYKVFNKMTRKNVVSWAALISGFAQNGFAQNAIESMIEMQNHGFQPDLVCLVGVLSACSQIGSLKWGKSLHCYILKRHVLDQVSATALTDMYSKCGALSCSRAIFDRIEGKDLVSWTNMISCYGSHGNGQEALSIFLQMLEESNIEPDQATFTSLLSALSHSCLVEQGQHYFSLMINKYRIQPRENHYTCMIDLLARAGRVQESLGLINSTKIVHGLAIWVALLSGCINHRNFLVGEIAANKILELNPDDSGVQALVSNFFAMEKKWKEVAGVRRKMKSAGTKKVPGYSAVEVNGKLEAFVMEDMSHHENRHILWVLQNLDYEMRAIHY